MSEDTMHPACEICGKYYFAVDGCKGHAERWYQRLEDKKAPYLALVRRLVEIADNPSATERMVDYDRVARAHEKDIDLPTDGAKITPSMLDSKADLKALIDDSEQWTKEAMLAAEGAG